MIPLVCPICGSELKVVRRTVGSRKVQRGECPTTSTTQLLLVGSDVMTTIGKPGPEFITGWSAIESEVVG